MSNLIVVNPAAGRGKVGQMLFQVQEAVRGLARPQRLDYHFVITEGPGHARELAQTAGAERIIAVGGDGTVHEVIQGMRHGEQTLGVVPIGSGNDFARMLGFYRMPWQKALEVAFHGRLGQVDLGQVNGEIYASSLSMGFDAGAARRALTVPAFLQGMPRYLTAIFLELRRLELPQLTLVSEGQTLYQGPALLAAFMNSPTYGAGFRMAPHASPTDGKLSAVVAGRFNRLGVLGILPKVAVGRHIGHPQVFPFEAAHYSVRFDRPVASQTDGEPYQEAAEFEVRVRPGRLRVALP